MRLRRLLGLTGLLFLVTVTATLLEGQAKFGNSSSS